MPDISDLQAYTTEAVTVDATAGGVKLTESLYITNPPGRAAILTVETAQIRYLSDGTAPTSTTGHQVSPTQIITLRNPSELSKFRAIRTGATSGVVRVTFYR